MKILLSLAVSLLTACSSPAVRCERHLTRINPPQRRFSNAGEGKAAPAIQPQHSSAGEPAAKAQAVPHAGKGSP